MKKKSKVGMVMVILILLFTIGICYEGVRFIQNHLAQVRKLNRSNELYIDELITARARIVALDNQVIKLQITNEKLQDKVDDCNYFKKQLQALPIEKDIKWGELPPLSVE